MRDTHVKTKTFNVNGTSYTVSYDYEWNPTVCKINGNETDLKCIPDLSAVSRENDIYYTSLPLPDSNSRIVIHRGSIYLSKTEAVITDEKFSAEYIGNAFSKKIRWYVALLALLSLALFSLYAYFLKSYVCIIVPFLYLYSLALIKNANIIPITTKATRRRSAIIGSLLLFALEIALPPILNLIIISIF